MITNLVERKEGDTQSAMQNLLKPLDRSLIIVQLIFQVLDFIGTCSCLILRTSSMKVKLLKVCDTSIGANLGCGLGKGTVILK